MSGFIHMFAVLQRKLYKDTSQMELFRELLGLLEEMNSAPLYVIEEGSNHEVDSREDIREKAMKHSLLAQSMKLCSRD